MKKVQVNQGALFTAYARGYHSKYDNPKIFDDFLAFSLLTEDERKFIEQYYLKNIHIESFPDQATGLAWLMQIMAGTPITLARARYAEEILEDAVRQGFKQYVILGAGLDSFAFRCPQMLKQLQVFEVDHPETQAHKRQRLAELGWNEPTQLHFIPVDFTKENLVQLLCNSSYDPSLLTIFSWLGVTYYLPRNIVFAMLRVIAEIAPTGSKVVFDYLDTEAFVAEKASPRVQILLKSVQQLGEPMNSGFDPLTLAADLAPLGMHLYEALSPWDIQTRYFMGRTDNYHACEHSHLACVTIE